MYVLTLFHISDRHKLLNIYILLLHLIIHQIWNYNVYISDSFWIPLDPKPIFNDQVGSGPCAHTKFSSATWCNVSTGQKMSRKSHFQQVKSGKCSVNFHIFSDLWLLMMVLMAKQSIQTVFTCINSKNRASSRLLVKNSVSLHGVIAISGKKKQRF